MTDDAKWRLTALLCGKLLPDDLARAIAIMAEPAAPLTEGGHAEPAAPLVTLNTLTARRAAHPRAN